MLTQASKIYIHLLTLTMYIPIQECSRDFTLKNFFLKNLSMILKTSIEHSIIVYRISIDHFLKIIFMQGLQKYFHRLLSARSVDLISKSKFWTRSGLADNSECGNMTPQNHNPFQNSQGVGFHHPNSLIVNAATKCGPMQFPIAKLNFSLG